MLRVPFTHKIDIKLIYRAGIFDMLFYKDNTNFENNF